ncbi:TPA: hypothetical protein ACTXXA_002516 [Legionella anisa]
MKSLIGCIFSLAACSAWATDRGINYDPAHSKTYTDAQVQNNLQVMKDEILKDFRIAQQNGFTIIKTFYSGISTVDGKQTATMADLACPMGLKLMLGVYEFDPNKDNCQGWCDIARKKQVDDAIASVNKYNTDSKKCIIGIAVGNEDVTNWNFTQPNTLVQKNIAADIDRIKSAVGSKVKVGTAQQDGALLALSKNDPNGILGKLDFIGANIYPYWSSNPYTPYSGASTEFMNRYEAIKNKFPGKEIIVTEEGWPSQGSSQQNPDASMENEGNYYNWWKGRSDDFDSYYFALFDKQPTDGDADKFFGLCKADRNDKILTTCNE